ncbi:unnamed protein product [Alopecurus aequalis]
MDESSMSFQWAMETLQQEHTPATATYAVLNELLQTGTTAPMGAAAQGRATDSWSSGDWQFSSTMPRPTIHDEATSSAGATPPDMPELELELEPEPEPEPVLRSPVSRKSSVKSAASSTGTGHTSPEPLAQQRVMAERKRREKINLRFIDLSSLIPGLKKMNKATILSDAVRCIKDLQEKNKELEARHVMSNDSVVLAKRPCFATIPDRAKTTRSSLPEIEARISESNVMVRIHCEDRKGVVATLLTEVEGLHLTITQSNATTFPACTVNITIMAKVDEGFTIKPEVVVRKLDAALRRRHGG